MNIDTPGRRLLFSTVRIDCLLAGDLQSTGTGFILFADVEGGACPVIVTNKHVVANAVRLSAHFITRKPNTNEPNLGQAAEVTFNPSACFGHPDPRVDVAVIPLAATLEEFGEHLFFAPLPLGLLSTEVTDFYVDAIEEVTFVGYPNGHRDPKHFTPIVRRGITATPIDLDMGGAPAFLIDGSVFGGSSGSPVFLFNEGTYRAGPNEMKIGTRVILVGIIAQTMVRNAQLPVEVANTHHVKIAQELNLGVAFNARAIKETFQAFLAASGLTLRSVGGDKHETLIGRPEASSPTPGTPTVDRDLAGRDD
ncbi:trypsin-like peptidase domain-containing protein [Streptomyces sp. GbtcB6]|uniref:trypsin-like peptidase domain-containing protein n=1 Tax=Streptomyces sp. GbtcB6 TaxID=2824751 RepID=UPI001C2FBD8C|nr:trypsin-like peptidase domain-containing protein [Streptomyces sp. GbtcB6]